MCLSSQLQSLIVGVETGKWELAKEMLAFRIKEHSLVDDQWMEAALKESDKTTTLL